MKVLRWLAALFVLWLVWTSLSKSENYKMPPGSYDSQFFFEQDTQVRENPWVGILQVPVRDTEKYVIKGCVFPDTKCLFQKKFEEAQFKEEHDVEGKGRIGKFKPAEDLGNIPMYAIT